MHGISAFHRRKLTLGHCARITKARSENRLAEKRKMSHYFREKTHDARRERCASITVVYTGLELIKSSVNDVGVFTPTLPSTGVREWDRALEWGFWRAAWQGRRTRRIERSLGFRRHIQFVRMRACKSYDLLHRMNTKYTGWLCWYFFDCEWWLRSGAKWGKVMWLVWFDALVRLVL